MPETAVAESSAGVPLRELARRHGLHAAGARPSVPAYVRELWAYRHFIATYADAKVSSSLSKTRLGRLWQVFTPLTNAAVYFLIFGYILNTRDDVKNFPAYLCIGVFVFGFTQSTVQAGISSITGNLGLIRALQFPRASLPVSVTLVELQNMIPAMAVLGIIVLATGEPLTFQWLLIVPILILQSLFNAGLALFAARLGSKMIDLKQIMPFALRVWMYGSAVLYTVQMFERLDQKWLTVLLESNPAVVFIELMRHSMMEGVELASPAGHLWLLAAAWSVVIGVTGFLYFWRGEKEYGRG
ncbi:ABC transporter permease [Spirilliplanes yamanashiensis]|uniref:Transport permease protein n=1 Tax=Spirilliplanes yamanashiensis TaxID=42233 RepID=A0A8J4DJH0_9ACTN|nr:ABC transporter permease [Spirilliplanes yamanashiensis]MDP9815567.1 teichoic acid transport system permease protein [Spirilliplanes yamanashiensis]GIJ03821.1 transport permease protein [Spirilliplanes yamanashiensis]